MSSSQFFALSLRLQTETRAHFRDTWVLCDRCSRWRSLPPGTDEDALRAESWTCASAHPEVGCQAPLSRREARAFLYSSAEAKSARALAADVDQFPVNRFGDMHASDSWRVALSTGAAACGAKRPRPTEIAQSGEADSEEAADDELTALSDYERQRLFRVAANRERLRELLDGGSAADALLHRQTEAAARCALARRLRDAAAHDQAAAARAAARLALLASEAARAAAEAAAAAADASRARDECEARAMRARKVLAEAVDAEREARAAMTAERVDDEIAPRSVSLSPLELAPAEHPPIAPAEDHLC